MNPNKLNEILQLVEGPNVEFKIKYDPETLGRNICAFLNSGGGYVVCGVGDDGKVVGLDAKIKKSDVEMELSISISPKVLIFVEEYNIEGKRVIVAEVPRGMDIPYAYRNSIYVRDGPINRETDVKNIRDRPKNRKADVETIRDMVMRREREPERWERRFSDANTETDLDMNEIKSTINAVKKTGRIQFRDSNDPIMVLENMAVSKYGRLTNGGDVLFGKNPTFRHPQARMQAVCFYHNKTDDSYRDMKSFDGPLVSVLESAYGFIARNTMMRASFGEGKLKREDEPLYPPDAVREGLVNALAHRDYSDYSGRVAVHVYPDRLEIWNSGDFPEGITPEKLDKGHISVLRNPDIAHVLYLRGMMEKIGRGSLLIQELCRERGLPKPEWRSEEGRNVVLTFFVPEFLRGLYREQGPSGDQVGTKSMEGGHQVGTKVAPSRHQVGTKFRISSIQLEILKKCTEERRIIELMIDADRTDRTKFRNQVLNPLLRAELVEMTIPDKPTSSKQRYRITEAGKEYLEKEEEGNGA